MLTELLDRARGTTSTRPRDGQRGLHLGLTRDYDVMLLDRGLPAIEGLDLLTRLRGRGRSTPTLVLSALGNPRDRVEGLDAGAEDYLGKPFDVDELLARLRALLRRHLDAGRRGCPVVGGSFDAGDPVGAARPTAAEVALSERESMLLDAAGPAARAASSAAHELVDSVFEDAEEEGVVDTYVHYLRRKLGRRVVETVRGARLPSRSHVTGRHGRPPSYVGPARACRPACWSSACSRSSGCCCS